MIWTRDTVGKSHDGREVFGNEVVLRSPDGTDLAQTYSLLSFDDETGDAIHFLSGGKLASMDRTVLPFKLPDLDLGEDGEPATEMRTYPGTVVEAPPEP